MEYNLWGWQKSLTNTVKHFFSLQSENVMFLSVKDLTLQSLPNGCKVKSERPLQLGEIKFVADRLNLTFELYDCEKEAIFTRSTTK